MPSRWNRLVIVSPPRFIFYPVWIRTFHWRITVGHGAQQVVGPQVAPHCGCNSVCERGRCSLIAAVDSVNRRHRASEPAECEGAKPCVRIHTAVPPHRTLLLVLSFKLTNLTQAVNYLTACVSALHPSVQCLSPLWPVTTRKIQICLFVKNHRVYE